MNMRKTVVLLSLFFLLPAKAEMTARAVISAIDRTILSAEISGNVVYLPAGDGEYFKKGALLAKIDCAIYEAQQRKIEIQKKIALYQMQKNEQLNKLNAIGAFEVLISQEEYSKQGAELDIVSVNVKRCKIYAPFNGRVVEKKVKSASKHKSTARDFRNSWHRQFRSDSGCSCHLAKLAKKR
jgi:membrane fusion protein (multidrug efflux system)